MAFDTITGTKSIDLTALPGSIPDTQLVLVPDPVTGELYRSTFGQMKADIILEIGDLSYLDDIIEVPTVDALPQPGQVKKIYVITSGPDANTQWRWGGSIYIEFPQGSGDVAGEAILRGNADATLQANINAETALRITGDANLQTNINNEATNRTNADTTINNRVSAEINARTTNDNILNAKIDAEGQIRATADNNLQSQIDLKLNASDYNQHYKGKFTSLAALQAALPAAAPGDYAQVDTGAGNDVKNYNWDDEEGWVIGGTVAASTTDALPEGSTNLYFTTERAQAAVDISGKADKTYVDDADQALSDRIDAIQPAPSPTGSRIISGCKESWSGTGLTFDVTPGTYQIQGTPYTFSGDSKTLVPADATSPRFDVLALNTSQQLIVITGTPGANPDIPQVDPDSQLYLTAIYVAAGATTPVNVDLSLIYSENAEWVGAANGLTVDFNDTTSPFSGTKDIKVSGGTNGGYLSLTADIAPDITNYSLLKLYIKLNTVLNNKSNIVAAFYSLNKQITQFVTLPINKNLTGSYQNISIDITNFQFSKSLFDTIRFTFTGATFSAFYLDYIQLQGAAGSTQIVNVQDATTTTKGIVKLAGDLAGTADAPTVPGLGTLQTNINNEATIRAAADNALQNNIDLKLNIADYNQHYKGKYTSLAALQAALPTAVPGDYAQVDTGAGNDVKNYNWDDEEGWVIGGTVAASTTDALPEGSTNLYFTAARAQASVDISGKVDKVTGKQLSTEDYTTAEKTKLAGIAAGAQVNDANTTLQGNTFNGANQLVKLDVNAKLPAIDGSQLTNLPSGSSLPSMTGNTGKFLSNDGSSPNWSALNKIYLGNAINPGGTSTYSATIPEITSLVAGQIFVLKFSFAATSSAATLNVNGYGAKSIFKNGNVVTNSIDFGAASQYSILQYDGTNFQLVGNNMANIAYLNGFQTFTSNNTFSYAIYSLGILATSGSGDFRCNLFVPAGTGIRQLSSVLQMSSATVWTRVLLGSGDTEYTGNNSDSASVYIVNQRPGYYSGTYKTISSLLVKKPTSPSGQTVTDLQTAYFDDAPTGGVNNWSINAGRSKFRGGAIIGPMTTTERLALPVTANDEGLEVYDLTLHKKVFYNGSAWEQINSTVI